MVRVSRSPRFGSTVFLDHSLNEVLEMKTAAAVSVLVSAMGFLGCGAAESDTLGTDLAEVGPTDYQTWNFPNSRNGTSSASIPASWKMPRIRFTSYGRRMRLQITA